MPKRSSNSKQPRDVNQFARAIADEATGETPEATEVDAPADEGKNPAAVALGRLGGKKGGKARAEKLTPERRSEIARAAANARWAAKTRTPPVTD